MSSKTPIFSGEVLVAGRIQITLIRMMTRAPSSGEANHKPPLQKHTSIASRTTFKPFEQNISQQGCKSLQTRMSNLETSKDTPGSSSRCDVNFHQLEGPLCNQVFPVAVYKQKMVLLLMAEIPRPTTWNVFKTHQ